MTGLGERVTQVTQADRARENKRRLMLKLARGHDGIVSEREQGAELALKCGNGIATNYWGHLAKVAVRHFARHREQAVQEAVAERDARIAELEDELAEAIRLSGGSIIVEPMGEGLAWASTDTDTDDRVWHEFTAIRKGDA